MSVSFPEGHITLYGMCNFDAKYNINLIKLSVCVFTLSLERGRERVRESGEREGERFNVNLPL